MEIKAIKHFTLAYVRQKSALSWRAVPIRGVIKNQQVCALTHPPSATFLGAQRGQGKYKCLTIHCEMLSAATETETLNALLTLGVHV